MSSSLDTYASSDFFLDLANRPKQLPLDNILYSVSATSAPKYGKIIILARKGANGKFIPNTIKLQGVPKSNSVFAQQFPGVLRLFNRKNWNNFEVVFDGQMANLFPTDFRLQSGWLEYASSFPNTPQGAIDFTNRIKQIANSDPGLMASLKQTPGANTLFEMLDAFPEGQSKRQFIDKLTEIGEQNRFNLDVESASLAANAVIDITTGAKSYQLIINRLGDISFLNLVLDNTPLLLIYSIIKHLPESHVSISRLQSLGKFTEKFKYGNINGPLALDEYFRSIQNTAQLQFMNKVDDFITTRQGTFYPEIKYNYSVNNDNLIITANGNVQIGKISGSSILPSRVIDNYSAPVVPNSRVGNHVLVDIDGLFEFMIRQ